jgi:hypothetical protein
MPRDDAVLQLPAALVEALDTLDREVRRLELVKLLSQRQLSAETARLAVEGLQRYLAGDKERAAQIFEALGEELREQTMTLRGIDSGA